MDIRSKTIFSYAHDLCLGQQIQNERFLMEKE